MKRLLLIIILLLLGCLEVAAQQNEYKIGVYYFGGWRDYQRGSSYPKPWETIKPFPEREPLLGWYDDGSPLIMSQQLKWMKKYGIDYVVFNWYVDSEIRPVMDHAINAYLKAKDRAGVDFALLWSNHTKYIFSKTQFERLFKLWAARYLFRADYLRVGGKPIIFIFSAPILNQNAEKIGMKPAEFLKWAEQVIKAAGVKEGVSFIGGDWPNFDPSLDHSEHGGYAGFSAYVYHRPPSNRLLGNRPPHSFEEMDLGYREYWQLLLAKSEGLYVVPMVKGWDRRPWGGSKDALQDNAAATPVEFKKHLKAARTLMEQSPGRTGRMGIVCCWNEFGEGSHIEPTKHYKFQYLEAIRDIFGAHPASSIK